MYKDVLRSITGIEVFPIIALLIFLAFFIIMFIRVYKQDKKIVEANSRIPLEDESFNSNN